MIAKPTTAADLLKNNSHRSGNRTNILAGWLAGWLVYIQFSSYIYTQSDPHTPRKQV